MPSRHCESRTGQVAEPVVEQHPPWRVEADLREANRGGRSAVQDPRPPRQATARGLKSEVPAQRGWTMGRRSAEGHTTFFAIECSSGSWPRSLTRDVRNRREHRQRQPDSRRSPHGPPPTLPGAEHEKEPPWEESELVSRLLRQVG